MTPRLGTAYLTSCSVARKQPLLAHCGSLVARDARSVPDTAYNVQLQKKKEKKENTGIGKGREETKKKEREGNWANLKRSGRKTEKRAGQY
eukprot:3546984-Rhodomonas_salina.1